MHEVDWSRVKSDVGLKRLAVGGRVFSLAAVIDSSLQRSD